MINITKGWLCGMRNSLLLTILLFMLAACGKRGALIYPDLLTPAATSDVRVSQLDSVVKLSFQLPQKNQAGKDLNDLAGVDIFKRSVISGQPAGCNSCSVDYVLFKKVYINLPDNQIVKNGNQMILLDGDVRNDRDYSYYLIPFTTASLAGKPSLSVTIGVAESPLPPELKVVAEPTEIRLVFSPTVQKADIAGYNLYRAEKGQPLTIFHHNKELVKDNKYTDMGLKRGVSYVYAVRAVVKRANGVLAESGLSNQVETRLAEE
jgi:predicted small lipoprotein YifL